MKNAIELWDTLTRYVLGEATFQWCPLSCRAIQIIEYVKNLTQENPERRTEIALDSQQARLIFSGAGGEHVSRKETIRGHEES